MIYYVNGQKCKSSRILNQKKTNYSEIFKLLHIYYLSTL
jgi:hypothetical protein